MKANIALLCYLCEGVTSQKRVSQNHGPNSADTNVH